MLPCWSQEERGSPSATLFVQLGRVLCQAPCKTLNLGLKPHLRPSPGERDHREGCRGNGPAGTRAGPLGPGRLSAGSSPGSGAPTPAPAPALSLGL